MRNLIRSFMDFSWALSVFGASQATKALQTLPTGNMEEVTKGFVATSVTLKEQFDAIDRTIYQLGETAQHVLLGESTEPSLPNPATMQGTSGFVGVWLIQSYSLSDALAPPPRVLMTISQASAEILNGHYPDPSSSCGGTIQGVLSNDGRVWRGTFHNGIAGGRLLFVLSEGQNRMYGAWTPNDQDGPPRPWWGVRHGPAHMK